jgi:RNA-directed DNA polymerase
MSTQPPTGVQEWRDIDWPRVEVDVHTLQRRIYRASQRGEVKLVHRLQRLLMSSWSAKCLAVRKVTQDNQGKKTAGVDGIASLGPEERLPLVSEPGLEARPKPVRRVWIPKPGTDEKRPLGIPTMYDRALQALVKLALEPEWEAKFEPNSYGFRPGRSCHDAIEAIFTAVRYVPKYILDADIAKCFDRISHEALLDKLNTFPLLRRVIRAWLKAGVLDGATLFPTEEGTPQGGVISPLLANIALHGLETEIRSQHPAGKRLPGGKGPTPWRPTVIRYADDFVVLHRDEQVIRGCQTIAQEWLKGMGLELKPSKTRIGHTLNEMDGVAGFDFLGFTIRQFPVGKYHSGRTGEGRPLGFKTIIKPSKRQAKRHAQRLAEVVHHLRGAPQAALVKTLNPIIPGVVRLLSDGVQRHNLQEG